MAVSNRDMAQCREWIAEHGLEKNTSPAVLLYFEDFLAGTYDMSDEEVGQYIRLLCLQNSKGHLSMDAITRAVPGVKEYVLEKFKRDDAGLYYNERMEFEIYRRVKRKKTLEDNLQGEGQSSEQDPDWRPMSPYEANRLKAESAL